VNAKKKKWRVYYGEKWMGTDGEINLSFPSREIARMFCHRANNPPPQSAGIVGEWIACSDTVPEDWVTVLVWANGKATEAYRDPNECKKRNSSGWLDPHTLIEVKGVTHWCGEILPPQ
jgi:hypothetical protein